jgi:hypothetical protein
MLEREPAACHRHSPLLLLPYIVVSWFWAIAQTIPVRVCNLSSAPERDILEMKRTAEAAFYHSGVHLRWLECLTDSERDRALRLTVANSSKAGSSQAFGCAMLNSRRISVFFAHAKNVSGSVGFPLSPGRIMGYAAAHEIFHAVLRTSDHALYGIMTAPYKPRDLVKMSQGMLCFTPEQTRMLQTELSPDGGRETGDLVATKREPEPRRP